MSDLISRKAAINIVKGIDTGFVHFIEELPSAEPDFSCDGCMTPKYICGICMRNYPNITDHYCTGEAWKEAEEGAVN